MAAGVAHFTFFLKLFLNPLNPKGANIMETMELTPLLCYLERRSILCFPHLNIQHQKAIDLSLIMQSGN